MATKVTTSTWHDLEQVEALNGSRRLPSVSSTTSKPSELCSSFTMDAKLHRVLCPFRQASEARVVCPFIDYRSTLLGAPGSRRHKLTYLVVPCVHPQGIGVPDLHRPFSDKVIKSLARDRHCEMLALIGLRKWDSAAGLESEQELRAAMERHLAQETRSRGETRRLAQGTRCRGRAAQGIKDSIIRVGGRVGMTLGKEIVLSPFATREKG